jgi:hypothetical protein
MRLVLDLRLAAEPRADDERALTVTLAELAALLRAPRKLARLLWGQRYVVVLLREDRMRRSGVQAGAVAIAALARTGGFEIEAGTRRRALGRAAFLRQALAAVAVQVPAESLRTVRLLRAVDRVSAASGRSAPSPPLAQARSVAYLRASPRLTWKGAYVGGAAAHTTGVIDGLVACGLDVDVFACERPRCSDEARFTKVPLERASHLVS